MSDGIMLVFGEDGVAREYDDTWDITIHCESEKEQKAVWEKLNNLNREVKNLTDTISRQAAIDALSQYPFEKVVNCISIIEELPSAQPEIIHCQDCIHWKSKEYMGNNDIHTLNLASLPCKNWSTAGDWFCGSAERREG